MIWGSGWLEELEGHEGLEGLDGGLFGGLAGPKFLKHRAGFRPPSSKILVQGGLSQDNF